MVLLLDLWALNFKQDDKALVFSQRLSTLDLIESFLTKLPWVGKKDQYYRQGKEWYVGEINSNHFLWVIKVNQGVKVL